MTKETELYWYEMLQRPISIGTQPKGMVSFDEDKGNWGIVAYDHPLTKEELEEYEMGEWSNE